MAKRLVLAVGALALVAVLAVTLTSRSPRRSGTDMTPNEAFVAVLGAGQEACQGQDMLPADTAAVRLTIGTYGHAGPPISVKLTDPRGALLAQGGLRAGWRQGSVTIPVGHVREATANTGVCVRNQGPGNVAIAGTAPDPGYTSRVAGVAVPSRLRVDYLRPGRESWLSLLPTVIHRFSFGKAGFVRHWAWIAVALLMLTAIATALLTVSREERA